MLDEHRSRCCSMFSRRGLTLPCCLKQAVPPLHAACETDGSRTIRVFDVARPIAFSDDFVPSSGPLKAQQGIRTKHHSSDCQNRARSSRVRSFIQCIMWNPEAPPLSREPFSDPFLQMLSMSPTSTRSLSQAQSCSANSTASSGTSGGWQAPNLQAGNNAGKDKFVPQQQTVGFDGPK